MEGGGHGRAHGIPGWSLQLGLHGALVVILIIVILIVIIFIVFIFIVFIIDVVLVVLIRQSIKDFVVILIIVILHHLGLRLRGWCGYGRRGRSRHRVLVGNELVEGYAGGLDGEALEEAGQLLTLGRCGPADLDVGLQLGDGAGQVDGAAGHGLGQTTGHLAGDDDRTP